MSFTTLTALALDNGFRIVIYFAGIKVNLLEQTTKRLKKDLNTDGENARFFKVYQSPSISENVHGKIQSALRLNHKPAVLITVLKHYKHIEELTKIFKTAEVREELGNNGVLIIDDEADQASLNTYARKNSKTEDWEDDDYEDTENEDESVSSSDNEEENDLSSSSSEESFVILRSVLLLLFSEEPFFLFFKGNVFLLQIFFPTFT
jgi:hypothetical protein